MLFHLRVQRIYNNLSNWDSLPFLSNDHPQNGLRPSWLKPAPSSVKAKLQSMLCKIKIYFAIIHRFWRIFGVKIKTLLLLKFLRRFTFSITVYYFFDEKCDVRYTVLRSASFTWSCLKSLFYDWNGYGSYYSSAFT